MVEAADAAAGVPAVIHVEVVFAGADRTISTELVLPAGTSAGEALALVLTEPAWRQLPIDQERLGVFSRRVDSAYLMCNGDRLECYRPLQLDPKDARRRRAGRHDR